MMNSSRGTAGPSAHPRYLNRGDAGLATPAPGISIAVPQLRGSTSVTAIGYGCPAVPRGCITHAGRSALGVILRSRRSIGVQRYRDQSVRHILLAWPQVQ